MIANDVPGVYRFVGVRSVPRLHPAKVPVLRGDVMEVRGNTGSGEFFGQNAKWFVSAQGESIL